MGRPAKQNKKVDHESAAEGADRAVSPEVDIFAENAEGGSAADGAEPSEVVKDEAQPGGPDADLDHAAGVGEEAVQDGGKILLGFSTLDGKTPVYYEAE